MHSHLARQLRKLKLTADALPSDLDTWRKLLKRVSGSYEGADRDRYLLERSLDISSREMQDLYESLERSTADQLARQRDQLASIVSAIEHGLCALNPQGEVVKFNAAADRMIPLEDGQLVLRSTYCAN